MSTMHETSKLDDLIVTTIDSIKGYEHSADKAKDARLNAFFGEMAAERREVVARLQERSRAIGGTPSGFGSAAATIHRRVEDLRRVLGGGDAAILSEIERGEDYLTQEFDRVLKDERISAEGLAVVQACYPSVQRGHERAKELREVLKAEA